ncbi:MAG TPA: xanthine dehydrogenase family protein molybdopterin-binding subunit [Ilumatobacteraceae bacterium]|nr:xanthine dehydrogenase family protein molybdopterin-binding subunit [Ilumatobacteraceae bacterium]
MRRTHRREDDPLLRGRGTFIDGLRLAELEGALHAAFVRSIEPHGRLVSVDTSGAAAMPGVVAVLTGQDLTDVWVLPPRLPVANKAMVRPMMAQDVVRFVGEPLAVVLAESPAQAADAAEAVLVETEFLPPVIDLDDATLGAVLVHEAAGSNVSFEWSMPPFETDPFAGCEVVEEFTMRHPRLHAAPIEPRAGAAVWGPDGRCTVWVCSQRPAGAKYVIECALGLEPGTVRAIAPDVGGGFGAKGGYGCQPEDVVLAWAARRLGRPVRWVETRSESMLSMGHGRASTHRVRIGGSRDGRVLAYEVEAVQDSGAYPAMGTFITTNLRNSGTGVYDIATARVSGRSVVTNTSSTMALRGAGRPEAACDIERAIDRYAAIIGLDPVEMRRRNLVSADAFPYKTAVGSTYDSGCYAEALDRCVEAAGYEALRTEQAERRRRGSTARLGIGVSCTVEITGGGEGEHSSVTVEPDGSVTVVVGTSPHGQAHETTFAAIVADELGIPADRVQVLHGDTDVAPFGGGTIGSRSAQLGGSAAYGAAREVVELARQAAAELLEAAAVDIVFERTTGRFYVAGTPARDLGWTDLGRLSAGHHFKPEGGAGTFAYGACVATIELDIETGAVRVRSLVSVDDAGTLLQPQLAQGQVHGGLALAVAAALYEEMVYDDDGVPRTANLADYALVSAAELPSFETHEMQTPSPWNPLGVKGVGESGTVMATAALQSAVLDALREFGVDHLDLPYTPQRVWQAMKDQSPAVSSAGE